MTLATFASDRNTSGFSLNAIKHFQPEIKIEVQRKQDVKKNETNWKSLAFFSITLAIVLLVVLIYWIISHY